MKALWLSALTAACLLVGSAAHAGDHGHRGGHHHHDGRHDRHEWRGHDHDRWDRRHHHGWDRHVRYREVYYRPVYYRPAPVYYERVGGYRHYDDGEIHGSIRIGF